MRKYQARIISIILAMIFIMFWDYLFYFIGKNPINWPVDIVYTAVTIVSVWMLAYYIDEKQRLVKKMKDNEWKYKQLSEEKTASWIICRKSYFKRMQRRNYISKPSVGINNRLFNS